MLYMGFFGEGEGEGWGGGGGGGGEGGERKGQK